MPVEQVGRLLRRWQDTGGVLSRARVIADGMRLLSSLTADERHVLARALAEQGAPDLAARLETTSGGRIDAGDLHRTAEGLLALDRDQIDHLAATLSDRDQRLRLAHEAATHGVAQLSDAGDPPPPPSTSDGVPPPPPPAPGSRLSAPPGASGHTPRVYPTESLHALANGAVPLDDPELGDQMLDHPGLGEVQLTEVGLTEVGLTEVGLAEVGLTEVGLSEVGLAETVDGTVHGDSEAVGRSGATSGTGAGPSVAAGAGVVAAASAASSHRTASAGDATSSTQEAEHDSDRHADASERPDGDGPTGNGPSDAAGGSGRTPGDGSSGESGRVDGRGQHAAPQSRTELVFLDHLGATPAVDPAAADDLVDRLRQAGSAHRRFAIVRADSVSGIGAAAALRVLDAVPEGWQRRRVAERLGAAGALHGVRAPELLGRFPRDSDAAFVAGAALDHGSLSLDDLDGAVPDRLLRRLTIRAHTHRRSEP